MELGLKGKYALVCGSTQGIGKQTAIELASEGVNVTLIARNENSLKNTLQDLPEGNHTYIVADFTKPEEVREKVDKFVANEHGFHILINNTGGPPSGAITEASPEQFYKAFDMHLICSHLLAQACIPFMKKERFGRIINVISTSVKEPIPGLGVSNTIRNAVGNWSKTLSFEIAAFGITVNNVLPGFTSTSRLEEIVHIKAEKESKSVEEMEQQMKNYSPAQRFASPEETAAAITFLASERAAYINGINLPVDGGRTKSL